MNKKIIIPTIIAATAISVGASIYTINQGSAKSNTKEPALLAVTNSDLTTTISSDLSSKDETVYFSADATGATTQTFVGSTLYTGDKTSPVDFKVTYTLDGNEISPNDLKGKSGHVKIKFAFNSTAKYQGKFIPFLAVSGTIIDEAKFKNLSIDYGRIIRDGSRTIAVGYALPGINSNFNVDFIPDSFTIEADVTDFELNTTYTLLTNEVIAELDTTKLTTIDGLLNSVSAMEAGFDQIVSGSNALSSGLGTAVAGITELKNGSAMLAQGAADLSDGMGELKDGLSELASHNDELMGGLTEVTNFILDKANAVLTGNEIIMDALVERGIELPLTIDNAANSCINIINLLQELKSTAEAELMNIAPASITSNPHVRAIYEIASGTIDNTLDAAKNAVTYYDAFYRGLGEYTSGVALAANGANLLEEGTIALKNGADTLSSGIGTLLDGETKLYEGSVALENGLNTFKTSAIDRLANFANSDLASFTYNARRTVEAAASYHSFSNPSATSVKFIIKTASI